MRETKALAGVLIALPVALLSCVSCAAAQEPTRKLVVSLEPGETIMMAESVIGVIANGAEIILVTTRGKGNESSFSVFRGGAKKGPFKTLKDAMTAAYEGRGEAPAKKRECARYEPGAPPPDARVSGTNVKGGQALQFKGTTLGPHMVILSNQVTPDGAVAYITAMDRDQAWFKSTSGQSVSFGGTPVGLKVSPDGRNAVVVVQGSATMNDMDKMAKLPPDKMVAAFEAQEKKFLYTIKGDKFGPFDSRFDDGDVWFTKTSNDLYFRAGDQVFRNGAPMMKADSFDPCHFYPTPDGRSYATFDYATIRFSDGKNYPSPLDVVVYQDKGKTVVRWIALENNKDLVVYERTL